jgi:hypothetical protein
MIFVKQTLDYLKKNFIFLIVFAVIPAVMYAINNTTLNIYNFFIKISTHHKFNFVEIYKSFSTINYNSFTKTLLSFLATIVFVSLILAFIEKHMRIGKRTFKGIVGKLNDNIMPVFLLIFLFIIILEIWSVLLSAFLITAAIILQGTALLITSSIICLILYLLLFMLMGLFVIWLPCILITGFNYSEAFVYSASLMADHKKDIVISLVLPYILCNLIAAFVHLAIGNTAGFIVLIVAFIIYFIYYTSLMYVIYFYLTKETREDLKKKYF